MKNLKKRICIVLVLCICLGISGCSGKSAAPAETEPKTETITLTPENFEEYFWVTCRKVNETEKRKYSGILDYDNIQYGFDYQIEISKKVECKLSGVALDIHVKTHGPYVEKEYWPEELKRVQIRLSTSGEATGVASGFKSYDLLETYASLNRDVWVEYEIICVVGTIEIEK